MPRKRAVAENKENELNDTLGAIRKRYGDTSVRKGSAVHQPDRISTGAFILDFCLLGGIPHNRCTMLTGEKSAGKSMLSSMISASAQAQYPDQTPVIVDVEGTFDAAWAAKLAKWLLMLPMQSLVARRVRWWLSIQLLRSRR
jgi:RecA/RadA recombinase